MTNKAVFAIDPGNQNSAYTIIQGLDLKPIEARKVRNDELLYLLSESMPVHYANDYDVAIEMVTCYGMAVGKDVFQTCVWIGRFAEAAIRTGHPVHIVYRIDEKLHICGSARASDTNIRRALIDRFAQHDFKTGHGRKQNPDWFYGFSADMWAAYAVAITFSEGATEGGVIQ